MNLHTRTLLAVAAIAFVAGCGQKVPEEPPAAAQSGKPDQSNVDLICSYAPSQSAVVSHVASVAGGGAIAAAAIAKAAGLTAVLHSSGAYIFTGAGGYLASTLGTAIVGPVVVGVGIAVGGSAATLELLCAPRNHPDMVARVEAAVQDFVNRAKSNVPAGPTDIEPIVAKVKGTVIKAGNDAFEYASRKTVEVSEAFKK